MNLKNSVNAFIVAIVSLNLLSACGSSSDNLLLPVTESQIVTSQSFNGVYNEIEDGVFEAFGMMDQDENQEISPTEFGVDSPNNLVTFREADLNRDGKITLNEMMPDELKKLSLTQKLKTSASNVFNVLDRTPRDGQLSHAELKSAAVSTVFEDFFLDYDNEKTTKNYLSKSEFQNLFAYISCSNYPNNFGEDNVLAPNPQTPKPVVTKPKPKKAKAPAKPKTTTKPKTTK